MEIRIKDLNVICFKGLKNFNVNFDGNNALIIGRNATGKTTFADAFYWLIDGTDSSNQTKFDAIELNDSGAQVSNQDAVVEGTLIVDGNPIKLRRELTQRWKGIRGSIKKDLVGTTTKFYINDAKVKKKEYEEKITSIIKPDLFRNLSEVSHFVQHTSKEYRRGILMKLAGKITDADIIKNMGLESELEKILAGMNPQDWLKVLNEKRKELEKEIEDLPKRIDETRKLMPTKLPDEPQIRKNISEIQDKLDAEKNEILAIKNGLAATEIKKAISNINIELAKLEATDIGSKEVELDKLVNETRMHDFTIGSLEKDIIAAMQEKERIKEQYYAAVAVDVEPSDICACCGQRLPEDQIIVQFEKANAEKTARISEINNTGEKINNHLIEITQKKECHEQEHGKLQIRIEQLNREIEILKVEQDEKKEPLLNERAELQRKAAGIHDDIETQIAEHQQIISLLQKEMEGYDRQLSECILAERCKIQIAEREEQLKINVADHETTLNKIDLIEQFSKRKSEYIEANINGHFRITQWKLFENYQSGGYREICEPTRDGIPYSTLLNTGSKINVGLDIIDTLSEHYGVKLPTIIDNAERVTDWEIEHGQQIIKLVATPNVQQLEVVIDEK